MRDSDAETGGIDSDIEPRITARFDKIGSSLQKEGLISRGISSARAFDPDIKHKRREIALIYWLRHLAIGVGALIVILCLISYAAHAITPHEWRWLDESDLNGLRSLTVSIFSGVFASSSISYFWNKRQ